MNTQSTEYRQAQQLGESLIGKKAQSRTITYISDTGTKRMEEPQEITGFEIVENFQRPTLMVTIGGEQVFEELLINIH